MGHTRNGIRTEWDTLGVRDRSGTHGVGHTEWDMRGVEHTQSEI